MNNKTIFAVMLIMSVFAVSTVLASYDDNGYSCNGYCDTAYQIRPGNQINFQIPHFECCECNEWDFDCDCPVGDYCTNGDILRKQLILEDVADCGGSAVADINVFNYMGLDNVEIKLRIDHLFPRGAVYNVYLIDEDTGYILDMGVFRTNKAGRGYLNFDQKVPDFTQFDALVVEFDGEPVFVGDLTDFCDN